MAQRLDQYEKSLIGCLLIQPNESLFSCKKHQITVNSFTDPECREAYRVIDMLATTNKPIDIVTVEKRLKPHFSLDPMCDSVGAVSHAEHYAEDVKVAERRRRLIKFLGAVTGRLEDNCDMSKALGAIQSTVIELTETSGVVVKRVGDVREGKIEQWKTAQTNGFIGVPFTLPSVNNSLGGWRKGCVGIIAGYRGEGKSTLVRQQCLDLAKSGVGVALFTLEDPIDIACASMVGYHSDISVFGLDTGRSHPDRLGTIDEKWKELDGIPLYVSSGSSKIDEIEATTQMLKMKHGIQIVFIDHVQYITPLIMRGMSRNDTMAYYSQRCSALAKQLDLPVVLASQLSRDSEKANRKPKLSDLRDSGTLEQDSRQIIMLYYDGEKEHHVLDLQKNNFGESNVEINVKRVDGRQHFEEVQDV